MRQMLILIGAVVACDRTTPRSTRPITLTAVASLEGSGDTLDLLSYTSVNRSRSGNWYVVRVSSPRGHLGIYDSAGRMVRVFLPTGSGPGEISNPANIVGVGFGPGDSILVGDRAGRASRISVFSPPPNPRLIRSFDGPGAFETTPFGFLTPPIMASARFYKEYASAGAARMIGVPPFALTWSGVEYARFGTLHPDPRDNEVFGATRLADSTHLWFASGRRYRIDLLDKTGGSLRHLTRDVAWFPEDTGKADFPWVKRPPTRIGSIAISDGVLWVLINRASRDWEKRRPRNAPPMKPGMPIQMMLPYARTDLFESVLEAFDERSGEFLGTVDLAGDIRGFNNAGQLVEVREDSAGIVSLILLLPSLDRR